MSNIYEVLEHSETVSIRPDQMNADALIHIMNALKDKVEHKCNRVGYIMEVLKIKRFSLGSLPAENLNSDAIVKVYYTANTCVPKEGDVVSAKVETVPHVVCSAGPLWIFIGTTNTKVKVGDIVDVKVNKVILNANDHTIKVWGELVADNIPQESIS